MDGDVRADNNIDNNDDNDDDGNHLPQTMVSSSQPVKREKRGTGTTRARPSRTQDTAASNSWSLC